MNWIFIAVISGSIVTSGHETKEQCLGRKALLSEQKIEGKCVEAPSPLWTGTITAAPISKPLCRDGRDTYKLNNYTIYC